MREFRARESPDLRGCYEIVGIIFCQYENQIPVAASAIARIMANIIVTEISFLSGRESSTWFSVFSYLSSFKFMINSYQKFKREYKVHALPEVFCSGRNIG